MRFHAWNFMVPYDNFMPFPCMESHGIIWFHELPCMESYDSMRGIAWKVCTSWFHAWNRMESCGSMHFHVWNHMIPCVELHGRSVRHGSMHGIVLSHTDHMLPCMELHGSLINLGPGIHKTCYKECLKLIRGRAKY